MNIPARLRARLSSSDVYQKGCVLVLVAPKVASQFRSALHRRWRFNTRTMQLCAAAGVYAPHESHASSRDPPTFLASAILGIALCELVHALWQRYDAKLFRSAPPMPRTAPTHRLAGKGTTKQGCSHVPHSRSPRQQHQPDRTTSPRA